MSHITWQGSGKPRHTQTSTNLEELPETFENRRYWFARHCYKYRGTFAPSGRLWEETFEKLEGVPLREYIQFAKKNKLGEKYGIPNRVR